MLVVPFKVVLYDQSEGLCEESYSTCVTCETLEEALLMARNFCKKAIRDAGSISNWLGVGDTGIVYDNQEKLIWDGTVEFQKIMKSQDMAQ
jgi:hypothetical protein